MNDETTPFGELAEDLLAFDSTPDDGWSEMGLLRLILGTNKRKPAVPEIWTEERCRAEQLELDLARAKREETKP